MIGRKRFWVFSFHMLSSDNLRARGSTISFFFIINNKKKRNARLVTSTSLFLMIEDVAPHGSTNLQEKQAVRCNLSFISNTSSTDNQIFMKMKLSVDREVLDSPGPNFPSRIVDVGAQEK